MIMIQNYLKIAWRNLMKNKVFSFINVLGLSIGITVCMMIYLFIMNEFSVDKFHKNGKRIYRVMRQYDPTRPATSYLSGPYADALVNDYPNEIEEVVRVMAIEGTISFGSKIFNEKRVYLADANFFKLFSFPLIKGNPATALKDPSSVVITQTTAKKYFGNADPIGKVIEFSKELQLKVAAVAGDVPSNSHLNFDVIVPLSNYAKQDWFNAWLNNNCFTYVKLRKSTSEASLERKFPQFMEKYMAKEMAKMGAKFQLSLTPLHEVYFENVSAFDNVKHGDKKVVFIFLSIAILILLIACINFMNLSTIRAVERSKEVGLRKVMGARRNNLVWQFIGESVMLTVIACLLSVALLQLCMPFYNQVLGYSLTVSWNALPLYAFLIGVIIIVGLLAGSYPALFLSGFSPIQALKGKLKLGKGGSIFRHAMVVTQFSISVFLIIGTLIIVMQMKYVKNRQLGYDQAQTMIIPINNADIYSKRLAFKDDLQNRSEIISVATMSGEPGGFFDHHTFEVEGRNGQIWKARTEFADFEFVKTLGLKIIAGRDLSGEFKTDTAEAVLINRTAAASLGYTPEQAIGKWIKNTVRDQQRRYVVGVIEDFNFLSLKEKMDALVISPREDWRVLLIKIKSGDIRSAVATVESVYNKVAPGYPFEYSFLDQKFDELYKSDLRHQTIIVTFSVLAIFIACLGLFGLASFTAAKRIKEIGVRKVLGSSTQGIVMLLSKDLLRPVFIAAVIAIPAGYYAMSMWLQNFEYRIDLNWWIFALAAAITIAIALFTVSLKAVKAALTNPAISLRTE